MEEYSKNEEIFVGNQENFLQKSASPEQKIKKIDEPKSENDEAFMQFDMFDQNIKVVKTPSLPKEMNLEQYQNKYENLSSLEEIEPQKATDIDLKKIKKVSRGEVFGSKNAKKPAKEENLDKPLEEALPLNQEKEKVDENKSDGRVLSPEERIEIPKQDEIFSMKSTLNTDNNNDEKVVRESENGQISWTEEAQDEQIFENNDYRSAIGKLYNNSQLSDPYEKNRFRSFKEIFPSSNLSQDDENDAQKNQVIDENSESNISCDDINSLNSLFNLQGINIKNYKPKSAKTKDVYTDKSRLNMFALAITALLMIAETLFCYFIVRNFAANYFRLSKIIYYIACGGALCLFTVGVLENTFDKYKLIVMHLDFKKSITHRLIVFMFCVIVTFALCLAFGMSGLGEKKFLSFWILPIILSTNFISYFLIYYILYKTKKFDR